MSYFSGTKSVSGYQKLPGGLIIQWGAATGTTGNIAGAYPMAFPNAALQAIATMQDKTSGVTAGITIYMRAADFTSKTSITIVPNGSDGLGNSTARYFVVGY